MSKNKRLGADLSFGIECRAAQNSRPGGLGGLMGPERLLDFAARQLQTDRNR